MKPPRQGWPDVVGAVVTPIIDDGGVTSCGVVNPGVNPSGVVGEMKKLRVDFEQCWRHLQEESKARRQAEERIVELTRENSKLLQAVEEMEVRGWIWLNGCER